MPSVEIPLPEFGFDEIGKEKAQFIIQQILHQNALMQYFLGGNPGLEPRLRSAISDLFEDYEKLICIIELLNFLIREENNLKENINFNTKSPGQIANGFNKIRYVLYSLAKTNANYVFDKNTFTSDEVVNIESKINDIIYKLERLEAGQEIIFNEFELVKSHITDEFENLKSLPVLGKKTFYQIVFGKIATFTGNKIADEILKELAPYIVSLLKAQAPHLVGEFKKLIK